MAVDLQRRNVYVTRSGGPRCSSRALDEAVAPIPDPSRTESAALADSDITSDRLQIPESALGTLSHMPVDNHALGPNSSSPPLRCLSGCDAPDCVLDIVDSLRSRPTHKDTAS